METLSNLIAHSGNPDSAALGIVLFGMLASLVLLFLAWGVAECVAYSNASPPRHSKRQRARKARHARRMRSLAR